jgi:hypothetical protein
MSAKIVQVTEGLFVKNRREQKRSVTTWIGCRDCGMYGSFTTPTMGEADGLFNFMAARHVCIERDS